MIEYEKKECQKSVRMKPTVYNYINSFEGKGFNDKLENLIIYFIINDKKINDELILKKKKLKEMNDYILSKEEEVKEIKLLQKKVNDVYERFNRGCK